MATVSTTFAKGSSEAASFGNCTMILVHSVREDEEASSIA